MLPLYLNVLLPKSSFISSYIYFVLFFILIIFSINYRAINFRHGFVYVFYLLVAFSLIIVSALLNQRTLFFSDLSEVFRVFIISVSFLYGLSNFNKVSYSSIYKFILFFLISQIIISIPQAMEIQSIVSISSIFWSVDKMTVGRVVGTMGNPNFLGILASSLAVYLLIKITKEKEINKTEILQLGALFVFIIFAGSRTSLLSLTFGAMIVLVVNFRTYALKLIAPCLILIFFYDEVYNFILGYEGLRYISEPLRIYEKSKALNLLEVNALNERVNIWERAYQLFISSDNQLKYIFGLGPGKEVGLSFLDNQYLFWFFKYGLVGCILFSIPPLLSIIISMKYLLKEKSGGTEAAALCFSFTLVFLINGLFAETFSSMMVSPLFYFTFGLLLGRFLSKDN